MQIIEQQAIRDQTSALVLDWAARREPPFTGETGEGFAEAITVAHLVADEGRVSLHRWIDAARRNGLSWTEIGNALGISKQAAQQRFKPAGIEGDFEGGEGEEIVRVGATAFNEMSILREEGRKGRELVRTGALTLVFRATAQSWEYQRRLGSRTMAAEMKRGGWIYVSSWLPFHYFKRQTSNA
ncbi:hypothetical protein [Brevundimonas sp. SL130]|uniref:hypothetical protein n=1 Tax=Brevundimonas sp. SL130 TaxID=2995143 RepID=UPI00226D23BA|nr:hypothetical protein [Brevundimonas sp. SL130]WAC61082.1 hypothetical protein OU998_06490 [Brevundimonas sp. SL130]